MSAVVAVVAAAGQAAFNGDPTGAEARPAPVAAASGHPGPAESSTGPDRPEVRPHASAQDVAEAPARAVRPRAIPSDGRPRRALLSIPAMGLHDLVVVPYRGRTDDAPGTAIQDRGVAASPYGPRGGVGPGGVGNFQVTAHRTSSTAAFLELPSMRRGDRIVVEAGGVRYVYEVRRTRQTSFRSEQSLAEQRAAVPGHPDASPTRAFITLSTCATYEDHAAGNYWADEFHNPEHRIDKIGVLVRSVPARPGR
jgi:sortase A